MLLSFFAPALGGNKAFAHTIDPNCTSAGISLDIRGEFQGTNDEAAVGHDETFPGGADTIDYLVTVSLTATQCPITDGEPVLTLPDGTVVDLDDDLALASGGSITYDVTGSPYTIDSSDLGSLAGAAANEVRASASIAAISHRASGLDQDVAASVNFDTLVIHPETVVTITASAATIASGDSVTLTITEENTGDTALTNPFVELSPLGLTLDETSTEFTGGDNGNGILDPGETWTWQVTDTPAGDTTYTATGHGTDLTGADITAPLFPGEEDSLSVNVINPGTVVTITASAATIASGDSVTLTITEENTGDDPLTNPFVELSPLGLTLDETSTEFTGGDNGNGILDPGETWAWQVTDTPASDTTYTATGHGTDSTGTDVTYPAFPDERDSVTVTVEQQGGFQGCTPGFWKNHTNVWGPTGFSPNQTLESVFNVPDSLGLDNYTLLQALSFSGGGGVKGAAQILLRAATAAVLNAAHPDVDYPRTVAEVIADTNAALASGNRATMLALAAELDADNNLGCSIDAHGNPTT